PPPSTPFPYTTLFRSTFKHLPPPAIYEGQQGQLGVPLNPRGGGAAGPGPGGMPSGAGGPLGPAAMGAGSGMPGMMARGMPAQPSFKGRALLSWRVALLPFLEQDALFREFKLNEPWDSPHNKKLLAKMPKVYGPIAGKGQSDSTYYQLFVGPGAAFEKRRGIRMSD